MTVAELRNRMSNNEFNQWVAFYSVEAKLKEDAMRKAKNRR
jgi:hypothetical protein